jgi:hypothetical protein
MWGNRRVLEATPIILLHEIDGAVVALWFRRKCWREFRAKAITSYTRCAALAVINGLIVLWLRLTVPDTMAAVWPGLWWFVCLILALYGWRYQNEIAFAKARKYLDFYAEQSME